jgi:dTDP-4-amino-4,6-dideoxygalactose transaminase
VTVRPLRIEPPLVAATLDEDDAELVRRWLRQPERWGEREPVRAYERAFATMNESRHAVAFKAGRVALSACLHALGLAPGDRVIVPGYTCVVVPNAVRFAGLEPVFCDIELDTYGVDARALQIPERAKAIVIHHLYGLVCRDYDALLELARARGLFVIEDCSHAAGARAGGRRVGTRGDVAFYSSEWSKVFTTGQGGVAVTDDDRLAARLAEYQHQAGDPPTDWIHRVLATTMMHYERYKRPAQWWRYAIARARYGKLRVESTSAAELRGERPPAYAGALPAPLAALGINQLAKLEAYAERRRRGAARWDAWCERHGYARPLRAPGSEPVFLRYPVLVEPARKRDRAWAQRELGLTLGDWFVTHLHPAPGRVEGCPNADVAVARCVNFPTVLP